MVAVDEWRECKVCADVLPVDRHHFEPLFTNRAGKTSYRRMCRHCYSNRSRERDRQLRHNPETRVQYLAERNRIARNAYARDPEKHARKAHEWWLATKADPVRWAHWKEVRRLWNEQNMETLRENSRINKRLLAERQGRSLDEIPARPVMTEDGNYAMPRNERVTRLPVTEPLRSLLRRLTDGYGLYEAAVMIGVDNSQLSRILKGTQNKIDFDTGDRICVRLGFNLFDFWPDYA